VHAESDVVGELDAHVRESGSGEAVEVLDPGERTGDAPHVRTALGPFGRRHAVLGDDI